MDVTQDILMEHDDTDMDDDRLLSLLFISAFIIMIIADIIMMIIAATIILVIMIIIINLCHPDNGSFEGMSSSHLGGSDGEGGGGGGRLSMVLPECEVSKLDDIVELFQVGCHGGERGMEGCLEVFISFNDINLHNTITMSLPP